MGFEILPARTWSWETPGGDSVYFAEIAACGIQWYGDHKNPLFGGYYTIGLQGFEDFLANGPRADANVPFTIVKEISSYLDKHRTSAKPTLAVIRLHIHHKALLSKLQVSLNGSLFFSSSNSKEIVRSKIIFQGSVPAARHQLVCAFTATQKHTGLTVQRLEPPEFFQTLSGQTTEHVLVIADDFDKWISYAELKILRHVLYSDDDVAGQWHASGRFTDADGNTHEETIDDYGDECIRRVWKKSWVKNILQTKLSREEAEIIRKTYDESRGVPNKK